MNYYVDDVRVDFDKLPTVIKDYWRHCSPGVRELKITWLNKKYITYSRRLD